MRFSTIGAALLASLAIAHVRAQDQSGRIEGVVVDAISHQPVQKMSVSLEPLPGARSFVVSSVQPVAGMQNAITDSAGSFAFPGLAPGKYQIVVRNHRNYPQTLMGGMRKTVEVSANDSPAKITIELMPGATISGHIVDEDGDPLAGCFVQPHPAGNFNRGVPMTRAPVTHDDGSYRIGGIPAGKYIVSVQCSTPVFEPRPLSAGPDPPPSMAYPMMLYPAASDVKSAQAVELAAGSEKSGVDFQMRPVGVTHIHGTVTGADWHGHGELNVVLVPVDGNGRRTFPMFGGGAEINEDRSFDIRSVFPGSYEIQAIAQTQGPDGPAEGGVAGMLRVDVADKPLSVSLQLHPAMEVSGKLEIEGDNNGHPLTVSRINIQLLPQGFGNGVQPTQPNEDGSFTFKSVLPAEYRVMVNARGAFLKAARMGGDDVTNRPLDLTAGTAGALEIVLSTHTGTIQGTAPGAAAVYVQAVADDNPFPSWSKTDAGENGQFKLEGVAPGKYRVVAGDNNGNMPEGGEEVTVAEGETTTVDVKAEDKP